MATTLVSAGLLAAACSGDKGVQAVTPHASIATAPERTTTTNPDPYAVPAVIDAAYVNRVLAYFDAAIGDIVRMVLKARTLTPEARERMPAIFADRLLSLEVIFFAQDKGRNFAGYFDVPGNATTTVTQIVQASTQCVFARVHKDVSAVGPNPNPEIATQWVALVPLDPSRNVKQTNPTPWMMSYYGFPEDHSEPSKACDGP